MPDGEVFTGPVEDSANGVVTFPFPAHHAGRRIDGVRAVFEHGVVVEATAYDGARTCLRRRARHGTPAPGASGDRDRHQLRA